MSMVKAAWATLSLSISPNCLIPTVKLIQSSTWTKSNSRCSHHKIRLLQITNPMKRKRTHSINTCRVALSQEAWYKLESRIIAKAATNNGARCVNKILTRDTWLTFYAPYMALLDSASKTVSGLNAVNALSIHLLYWLWSFHRFWLSCLHST